MFSISKFSTEFSRKILVAIVCILLVACAGAPSEELEPAERPYYCRSGDTPSCIEKVGEPVRCFCADEDALRELLDPNY